MDVETCKEALKKVIDPELGFNVWDLGLIYDLQVKDDTITVTMTLTTMGCPLHDTIVGGVKSALSALPGVQSVEVDLVWSPPWTPERISPEVMHQLQSRR